MLRELSRLLLIGCILTMALAFGLWPSNGMAQQELRIIKGKSLVLSYTEKIKTISIADDHIVDVVSITTTDMVIIGKEEGTTSLIVWGESGNHTAYDVRIERNTSGQQVELEVQVAEVNRSKISEYGIDMLFIDSKQSDIARGDKIAGSYAGGVTPPDADSRKLFIPDGTTGVLRWLGPEYEISAAIRALQRDGMINLLATPRLLCMSSQSASFLVGGEIPVPVAQSGGGGGLLNVTIEWKEYGIRLDFVPTIVDSNVIDLRISPEVSSLDYANMINFGGYAIPALRTRRAEATVEMNSAQSVVLGGLLSTEEFKTVQRVPILGHIPLLSFFFSRRETTRQETELLIVVTPRIVSSLANEPIPPLPFDGKSE